MSTKRRTIDCNEAARLQAEIDAESDDWSKEMAKFITSAVIGDVHAQLSLCEKILHSPVFQNVPFAVTALNDCALVDVSENGGTVSHMAERWRKGALERLEDTVAGGALDRFESLLKSDYSDTEEDTEQLENAVSMMRDAGICMLALGMMAGFEYANRRMQGATENLRKAVVEAKLVAA